MKPRRQDVTYILISIAMLVQLVIVADELTTEPGSIVEWLLGACALTVLVGVWVARWKQTRPNRVADDPAKMPVAVPVTDSGDRLQ